MWLYDSPHCHGFFLVFFPFLIQKFGFLFQNYQYIVHTAFLKTEVQRILSLSDHEASALHTSNAEFLNGLAFFPICSWPEDILLLFHKSEIGDTDTFKFVLFAFGNNTCPHLLLNFLFIKYWRNPTKIPKCILQIQWIIHSIPEKKHLWYYFDVTQSKYLHLDGSPNHWILWYTFTYHSNFPLFLLLQEPSTAAKVTAENSEVYTLKVNTNNNISDMDLCRFTNNINHPGNNSHWEGTWKRIGNCKGGFSRALR